MARWTLPLNAIFLYSAPTYVGAQTSRLALSGVRNPCNSSSENASPATGRRAEEWFGREQSTAGQFHRLTTGFQVPLGRPWTSGPAGRAHAVPRQLHSAPVSRTRRRFRALGAGIYSAPSSESRRHIDGWAAAKRCLVACAMPGVGHGGPSQRATRDPRAPAAKGCVEVDDTDQSLAVDGCCRSPSALSRRSRRTWSWRMCGSAAWTVAGSPLWSRWIVKAGRDGEGEGEDLSYETHHTRPSTV